MAIWFSEVYYNFACVVKVGALAWWAEVPVRGSANFPYCPEVSKYEKLAKVGQGTFG